MPQGVKVPDRLPSADAVTQSTGIDPIPESPEHSQHPKGAEAGVQDNPRKRQPATEGGLSRKFVAILAQLQQVHHEELAVVRSEVSRLQTQLAQAQPQSSGFTIGGGLPVEVTKNPDAVAWNGFSKQSLVSQPGSQQSVASVASKQSVCPASPQGMSDQPLSPSRPGEASGSAGWSASLPTAKAKSGRQKNTLFEKNFMQHKTRKGYIIPKVAMLVYSPWFETFFALLIIANSIMMALEIQQAGLNVGADLEYPGVSHSSDEWPNSGPWFRSLSWFFGIIFTVEVCLKIVGMRKKFWRDWWNVMDVIIVMIWAVAEIDSSIIPVNTLLLRLGRLTRLLRLMRLVRQIQAFDALYLMTTALQGSVSVLGWACILLFIVQMMLALFLTELLSETYLNDPVHPREDKQQVYEYFGTFSRSMLSMFEITLANWPPVCRLLSEKISEWFIVFAVVHKLTIGFAVVGVINGVFMQETFKVASSDDNIMVRQKQTAIRMHERKMRSLFEEADTSGDGYLSVEEFRDILRRQEVQTWLASMELDTRDADNVFALLQPDNGLVSVRDLIEGVARLKGAARSIDLVNLMVLFNELQDNIMFAMARNHHGARDYPTMHTAMSEHPPPLVSSQENRSERRMGASVSLPLPRAMGASLHTDTTGSEALPHGPPLRIERDLFFNASYNKNAQVRREVTQYLTRSSYSSDSKSVSLVGLPSGGGYSTRHEQLNLSGDDDDWEEDRIGQISIGPNSFLPSLKPTHSMPKKQMSL